MNEKLQDMKRNAPIYFINKCKKLWNSKPRPNATYLRDMGELRGESVCEIEYDGHPWIVRTSEILDVKTMLRTIAKRMSDEIEAAKKATGKDSPRKAHIALMLGIDPRTLTKRMKFIEENLTPANCTIPDPAHLTMAQVDEAAKVLCQ